MALPFEARIGGQKIVQGLRMAGHGDRGLIIALHGGGYDARYWDGHDGSLLAIGAAAGFEVVAVDRPGYRGSTAPDDRGLSLADQADILFALIDRLALDPERPVYLVGHSMGGILSVRMAGDRRGRRLCGIDVSGVPLRYPPQVEAGIAALIAAARAGERPVASSSSAAHRRSLFFGADGSFDPALTVGGDHRVPVNELEGALGAPVDLPPIMARIAIPVQWTIAAEEASSVGGQAMLDHVRRLLPACPHLHTHLQVASGHNISLHHVARAYHLRAIAFFEECRALATAQPLV